MTQRQEKRLCMTLFTMCLDLAVQQAYCIYQSVITNVNDQKHKGWIGA
jgi:hypothetical protein